MISVCLFVFSYKLGCHVLGLFFGLIVHAYDYNIHVEGLLPAKMCLVTLISLEHC